MEENISGIINSSNNLILDHIQNQLEEISHNLKSHVSCKNYYWEKEDNCFEKIDAIIECNFPIIILVYIFRIEQTELLFQYYPKFRKFSTLQINKEQNCSEPIKWEDTEITFDIESSEQIINEQDNFHIFMNNVCKSSEYFSNQILQINENYDTPPKYKVIPIIVTDSSMIYFSRKLLSPNNNLSQYYEEISRIKFQHQYKSIYDNPKYRSISDIKNLDTKSIFLVKYNNFANFLYTLIND